MLFYSRRYDDYYDIFYQSILSVRDINAVMLSENYLLHCILFFKQALENAAKEEIGMKKNAESEADDSSADENHLEKIGKRLDAFFGIHKGNDGSSRAINLFQSLILFHLRLNNNDIYEWQSNPEGYFLESESDYFDSKIKPAAEAVLVLLLRRYPTMLTMVFSDCFNVAMSSNDVLMKDSLYRSYGCLIADFSGNIDHDSIFHNFICPDAMMCLTNSSSNNGNNHNNNVSRLSNILLARLASVIGSITFYLSPSARGRLYQICVLMLGTHDLVVRMGAVYSLKFLIDDQHFSPSLFKPFLADTLRSLFSVLASTTEWLSKSYIVSSLNVLFENMDKLMDDELPFVIDNLHFLWLQSTVATVRLSLLSILIKVVKILGDRPVSALHSIYPVLLPIVAVVTDPKGE